MAMRRFCSFLIIVALIFCLPACAKSAEVQWQEQYDLGVRYLSEGNYEEAVIAFTAAIEIDPKRPEAYVGLADAYIGTGDFDRAEESLLTGQAECGDSEIFSRALENIAFLRIGETGIRITNLYFDVNSYLAGEETNFLVSVAYRCPDDEECVLMIGANTQEPDSFAMLDEDFTVTGSGGYQFDVSITPTQWDNSNFGLYVNLSEADHPETWTPIGSDQLYIDPQGNVVGFYGGAGAEYQEVEEQNLLESGLTDNMLRFEEIQFLGRGIEGLDIETMKSLMIQNGFELSEQNEDDHWWVSGCKYMFGLGPSITALQQKSEPYVGLWGYDSIFDDKEQLAIGVRDIYTYNTLEDVFSNGAAISSYIDDVASRGYDSYEAMRSEVDALSCNAENIHVYVSKKIYCHLSVYKRKRWKGVGYRNEKDYIAMYDAGPFAISAMLLRQKPSGAVAGAVRSGRAVLI